MSSVATAQPWPSRPITLVVPTAAGGGNDVLARTVAQIMSERLKQTIVVVNKAGAQGAIGTEYVANAAPDGYTILLGYIATHGINPALQKLRYDPSTDFSAIGLVATSPTVLIVSTTTGINSVQELIDKAKLNPAQYSYASAGLGTAPHVTAELFKMQAKINLLHVPYKGSAPGVTDTLAGTTQVMFPSLFSVYPHLNAGRIKAIAVAGDSRVDAIKDVPTLAEAGVPNVNVPQWYGLFAPAKTDPQIIKRLNDELNYALQEQSVIDKFKEAGANVKGSTPNELEQLVKDEVHRWKNVVAVAKISTD